MGTSNAERKCKMKKYELTDETLKIGAITLHRIKAVVAFADVSAGETGGWVEKEENLDQAGERLLGFTVGMIWLSMRIPAR